MILQLLWEKVSQASIKRPYESFPRRCRKVSIRKGSITKYQGYIPYRVSTTVIYWQTKFFLPSWKIGLHLSILSVSGEGYSRHALCALKIYTFVLLSRYRYLCSWTISSRGYHPLRHCHSLLDILITEIHSSKLM